MATKKKSVAVDLAEEESLPLFPPGEDECGETIYAYEAFDVAMVAQQEGVASVSGLPASSLLTPGIGLAPALITSPCSLKALNGSWLVEFVPESPAALFKIRGPMRIEAGVGVLRVSGDIYVSKLVASLPLAPGSGPAIAPQPTLLEPFVPGSLVIQKNWYPAFPQNEYSWYFRSTGVTYKNGLLKFNFERSLWNPTAQEFTSTDAASMVLACKTTPIMVVGAPAPTLQMKGTAVIGGRTYSVLATKTSPYYRGCRVEVDVMTKRTWPASATGAGNTWTFAGVYRAQGLDFSITVDEVNIPEDPLLSTAEMHTLLSGHRQPTSSPNQWRLWLFVGSKRQEDPGTFGLMFDTNNPPHREGSVGYFDVTLPNVDIIEASARGQKLGAVAKAFLRTMIHEAGHAFNLFHPKHDIHAVPVGATIMNQTGDVMGFATAANPYPGNATMAFNEHNRLSLIHSPDPQVKPGWKPFGWGHGTLWSGVSEPVDALGLNQGETVAGDLYLELSAPAEAVRGEIVVGVLTLLNRGDAPRRVSAALNLAEDDLHLRVKTPNGDDMDVRDVVLICGARPYVVLQPGETYTSTVQLFYTNRGHLFDQPGRYVLQAELHTGDVYDSVVRSAPVEVIVRSASSSDERELQLYTMNDDVGLSLAFGDFGANAQARAGLTAVMDRFSDTTSGTAAALVVANSLARDFRDIRSGSVARAKDETAALAALDVAVKGQSLDETTRLATAMVATLETGAPVIEMLDNLIAKARKGGKVADVVNRADAILKDFRRE